jgi:hypothetical protein
MATAMFAETLYSFKHLTPLSPKAEFLQRTPAMKTNNKLLHMVSSLNPITFSDKILRRDTATDAIHGPQ